MKNIQKQNNINAESVVAEIISIYEKLSALKSLAPRKQTNDMFRRLVELVVTTPKTNAELIMGNRKIKRITQRLRDICSSAEYKMEVYYSKKDISAFPYLNNYKKLCRIEAKEFRGKNILFIGSGPLPLSVCLYSRRKKIHVMDNSKEALELSKKFF